jgi:hypothetical protein
MSDLDFDVIKAVEAISLANHIYGRLKADATTHSISHVVLATTAHLTGMMSAMPLTCRRATPEFVNYTNAVFAATSAFSRLGLTSFLKMDSFVIRRFLMIFYDRPKRLEPLELKLGSDIERDLSAMVFFFEAYIRPGILVAYKFNKPRRWRQVPPHG